MKTKYKIYTALIAVCTVLLVLTGCSEMTDFSNSGGGGKLILSINAGTSRTIQPGEIVFDTYKLDFLDADNNDAVIELLHKEIHPDVTSIEGIPAGNYKLRVKALIGNVEAAEGESEDFEITDTDTAVAAVTLTPILTAEGIFQWNIIMGNHGVDVVGLKISKEGSLVDEYTLVTSSPGAGEKLFNDTLSLTSGRYSVVFNFGKGSDNWTLPQLLDIYPGMTSAFTWAFNEDLFTKSLEQVIIEAIKINDLSSILEAHFDFLDIKIGDSYNNLKTEMLHLYSSTHGAVLEDIDDLTMLVDVSLLVIGIEDEYDTEEEALEAIMGLLLNESEPDNVVEGDDGLVTLIFGAYSVSFTIKEVPLTSFDVKISNHDGSGTTTQQVVPGAFGGTVTLIPNGFETNATSGYGGGYNKFKVDFGTGNTFASIGRVKFTFNGISGDIGSKTINVLASATEPTSSLNSDPVRTPLVIAGQSGGGTPTNVAFDQPVNVLAANAAVLTSQEVWFVVYMHSNPAVFSVANVEFFKGVPCGVCGKFPCECVAEEDRTITITGSPVGGDLNSILPSGIGYEFVTTAGMGNSYVRFPVDLNTKDLSNYDKVEFTFEGVSGGDMGWKDIFLLINNAPFSGHQQDNGTNTAGSVATGYNGLSPRDFSINISGARKTALAGANTIYVAIMVKLNTAHTYKITNIKLIGNGATGSINIKFEVPVVVEYGLQEDGTYTLDPTKFSSWYGATIDGDTIAFANGGVNYLFPSAFNASGFEQLVIEYVTSNAGSYEDGLYLQTTVHAFDGTSRTGSTFNNTTWNGSGTFTLAATPFQTAGITGFSFQNNSNPSGKTFTMKVISMTFIPAP